MPTSPLHRYTAERLSRAAALIRDEIAETRDAKNVAELQAERALYVAELARRTS